MDSSHTVSSSDPAVAAATAATLAVLRRTLGAALAGVWLHGSAVAGGLRPDSDLDLLVAIHRPITGPARRRLVEGLLVISGRPGEPGTRPLEVMAVVLGDVVPWRYPPRVELVYGEWLRDALEAGTIAAPTLDPDLTVVLAGVRRHSHPLLGPSATDLLDEIPPDDVRRAMLDHLPTLLEDVRGDERNVMLTLARMWATFATGEIRTKDAAADWVSDRLPPEHRAVLGEARDGYLGHHPDDWTGRDREVDAFVRHARAAIESLATRR